MIVVAGLRVRTTNVDTGMFHCPNEGADRRYHHLRARRWFTLFFVPVIPLDQRGEWVECLGCASTYRTNVLARHPSA